MYFLTGTKIRTEVQRISRRPGKLRAAVAYWGDGAAERTGLSERENPEQVRIICDLLSGACNPGEIKALMQRGIRVKTLDRLHAKVWTNGNEVILGSANASHNGLPVTNEDARQANIETAFLSKEPSLAQELERWFKGQWKAATKIDDRMLALADDLWGRRGRSAKRAFTPTLLRKIRNPDSSDQFHRLRLIAATAELSRDAEQFLEDDAERYFSVEQWDTFGAEQPIYELAPNSEWTYPPDTVLMDFSGDDFSFTGFWQLRDHVPIERKASQIRLVTMLPHFDGYSLSDEEQRNIKEMLRDHVEQHGPQGAELEFDVNMDFLEFWDADRPALKRRLVDRVVDAARELCRTGRFDQSLTLRAVRMCKDDPEWLSGYTRFVGGCIYEHGNHLKQKINQEIGRSVRAAVGAEVVTDGNGRTARVNVDGELIQSYTPLASYDPTAVTER